MVSIRRINGNHYTDFREVCDGVKCPTPAKPHPHKHRRRKALGRDKQWAQIQAAKRVETRDSLKPGASLRGLSWEAFKKRYMAYSITKHKRTHYRDELAFRKYETLYPKLDKLQDAFTPEKLEAFKAYDLGTGIKPTSVNRDMEAIKAAIAKAVQWKMIDLDSAFEEVKAFKVPIGKLHYFEVAEIKTLLRELKGIWRTMVMLGYYAGLRRQEIWALKVSNVDFVRGRIHIEPTEEFTPKDYERRFIPMHPKLKEYLKKNLSGNGHVLGNNRPSVDVMTNTFKKLVRKAGLKGNLHKLRHSFGSHNAMAGVPPKKLQLWMGHDSLETTEIYLHLSPDFLDEGINRLPEA